VLETALRKESSFFDFTRPAEMLLETRCHQHHDDGFTPIRRLAPLSAGRSSRPIEVTASSIKMNKEAFRLGRLAVVDFARSRR